MENVDPRKVLEHCFHILSMYPDNALRINVYIGSNEIHSITDDIFYIIHLNEIFEFESELDQDVYNANNLNEFLIFLKNKPITLVELENNLEEDTLVLYRCRNLNCFDTKRWASTVIQDKFRKSRNYAAWNWSPEKIKARGEFEVSFGKNDIESDIKYLTYLRY